MRTADHIPIDIVDNTAYLQTPYNTAKYNWLIHDSPVHVINNVRENRHNLSKVLLQMSTLELQTVPEPDLSRRKSELSRIAGYDSDKKFLRASTRYFFFFDNKSKFHCLDKTTKNARGNHIWSQSPPMRLAQELDIAVEIAANVIANNTYEPGAS
jgi:hypothetical protein